MLAFIEVLRALAVALITNSHFDGVYPVNISWGGPWRGSVLYPHRLSAIGTLLDQELSSMVLDQGYSPLYSTDNRKFDYGCLWIPVTHYPVVPVSNLYQSVVCTYYCYPVYSLLFRRKICAKVQSCYYWGCGYRLLHVLFFDYV